MDRQVRHRGCLPRRKWPGGFIRPRSGGAPGRGRAHVLRRRATRQCLACRRLVISNFKRFLVGTFHGVSRTRLQECLDEFVFRFNRRFL